MSKPVAESVLDNVFYSIGYALGEAESRLAGVTAQRGEAGSGPEAEGEDVDAARSSTVVAETMLPRGAPPDLTGAALGAAAAAWLLARALRPHPVRWPRAILAGVAGSALAAAAEPIDRRLGTVPPEAPAMDGSVRLAAGIAAAVAYASLLYRRLPGTPYARGLIFGAIEAATRPVGGTFGILRRLSPHIAIPFETLASTFAPARGPVSAVAFGIGLGLYREGNR